MSSDRDTTRIVRSWLDEGVTTLPDRVLDQVLDQLPATPQRRPWWQAWRKHLMSNTLKLAMAAGVFLLAVAIGFGLYFGPRQNVAAPPPEASPPEASPTAPTETGSPQPTAGASPRSLRGFTDGEHLPAGTYLTDTAFPLRLTFTVPDGWEKWEPASDALGVLTVDGGVEPHAGFALWIIDQVYRDPCDVRLGGPYDPGPTVDDLAEAFRTMYRHERSTPVEVSLAGHHGKYVEIALRDDCDDGQILWKTSLGAERENVGTGDKNQLWILDVDGTRLVVMAAHNDAATEAQRAQLIQMVESIQIEAQPGARPSPRSFANAPPEVALAPGTYVIDRMFPANVTFTVPAGWAHWGVTSDSAGVLKREGDPPDGAGFGFFIVDNVPGDACRKHLGLQDPPVGPTVDDLAAALVKLDGVESSTPIDVNFAGHEGKYLELTGPEDLSNCVDPSWWLTSDRSGRGIFGPSEQDRVWILDVEGTRVVFNVMHYPDTPASDLAELDSIIQSVRIEPTPRGGFEED
jgi:hypothetical protein